MRLGEVKNLISEVLDEGDRIQIAHEPAYSGQAQRVLNFGPLMRALEILSTQSWNKQDYAQIKELRARFKVLPSVAVLETPDYNQLESYINGLNNSIPLYYSILSSFVEDQDEKVINIKLPSNINSLEDLDRLNKRLEIIFKLFNIDGQFTFQGFDKGTDWYVLAVEGILSYQFAISCLKIAQEYLKTRAEYFKAEHARIAYETSLGEKVNSEAEFGIYQKKYLDILLDKKVREVITEIGDHNGKTEEELHSQLIKATTKLVEELGEGTEFHLSLNPPKYAKEQMGTLEIDYVKSRQALPKKVIKTLDKPLEAPPSKESKDPEPPNS